LYGQSSESWTNRGKRPKSCPNIRFLQFKRKDAFETVENALPDTKDRKSKLFYMGRILTKMSSDGLLKVDGRTWYITEKGESEIRS